MCFHFVFVKFYFVLSSSSSLDERDELMMGSLGGRRQPSKGAGKAPVDVDAGVEAFGERVSGSGKEATNDLLLICNGGVDGGGGGGTGVLFSI